MKNQVLNKVGDLVTVLCGLSCERLEKINTDRAIALTEAIARLLAVLERS